MSCFESVIDCLTQLLLELCGFSTLIYWQNVDDIIAVNIKAYSSIY